MGKKVLTIQDISCVGQCSITVALPVISATGIETCVLPSAVLSTHTSGFSGFTFRDLTEDLPAINAHWIKENLKFDYIYTGYIGNRQQFGYITEIMNSCKTKDCVIIVDPVMADNGRFYPMFDFEYAKEVANLCSLSDIIVPNITEAAFLTGMEYKEAGYGKEYIESLIYKLQALNGKYVVLTGVSFDPKYLGVAVFDGKVIKYYFRDRINVNFHGTGDVFSSSFTGALANGFDIFEAAQIAADYTCEAIMHTIDDKGHAYGVNFEKAIPYLIKRINKLQ
ncbi:MAG TPA: pyridoxamine kinase [Clostridia bacterium]|mgnify:CR=1 FL=1|nr:pyridoxamine kinase [Clostridia bacterium]